MARIAILDFYNGEANQGMACLLRLVAASGAEAKVFDVRQKSELPSFDDFDHLISSGGPGDPHEVESFPWGDGFECLLNELSERNAAPSSVKKHAFLICHSYQMACIRWGLAEVTRRQSRAFGIYPMTKTPEGESDALLCELPDPFYVIDSREWQVVQPHSDAMQAHGSQVLAVERDRPHVPLERAAMMIRFTPEIVGTQFHPEGDEDSMHYYLNNPDRLQKMTEFAGERKVEKIKSHIGDAQKVNLTHNVLIPAFLRRALESS